MARSVVMALLGAGMAAGALQACGAGPGREDVAIQRLETRVCDKALECGCSPFLYDALGQPLACGEVESPGNGDFGSDGFGLPETGAFDPTCVERWVQWVDALSCEAPALPSYADLCPLYHGTIREGEPCQDDWLAPRESVCDRGLFCLGGTCRRVATIEFGALGQLCDLGDRCDAGLACDGSVCQRLPGPGEECLDGYLCQADALCNGFSCEARPGPGETCLGDCQPGSFCSADPTTGNSTCRLTRGEGEPCSGHRQCTSGNCPAGFCVTPAVAGERCDSQLPCGPGLSCVAERCESAACDLLGAF